MSWLDPWIEDIIRRAFADCRPSFEPDRWNDGGYIQHHNNCYNYVCDRITNTNAEPGRGSGHKFTSASCASLTAAAAADGLVPTDAADIYKCGGCFGGCWYLVALMLYEGDPNNVEDGQVPLLYHWLRRDSDGNWSHKDGIKEATNKDHAGKVIEDPRKADLTPYKTFCGFFCVNKANLVIG
jgi:hypothetical protein